MDIFMDCIEDAARHLPFISKILSILDMSTQIPPFEYCKYNQLAVQPSSSLCLTPRVWPSRLVPPEYGIKGILYWTAILTIFTTSSVESGYTTTLCKEPIVDDKLVHRFT